MTSDDLWFRVGLVFVLSSENVSLVLTLSVIKHFTLLVNIGVNSHNNESYYESYDESYSRSPDQ